TVQSAPSNHYEIDLKLVIDAKQSGKVAFILELVYGGLFVVNVPEEHRQPVLLIECPRLLFPFARQIIANVTASGNLPPLNLQPIDFVSLYRARMEQAAAEAAAQGKPVN